jgi:PAS domain S-box-containing protein
MVHTPLQVLIVEDNPDDAELIARALRRNGVDFDWQRVETPADFLRALERRPDVILSDYNLPAWTGLDAFEALREAGCDIPFILVTGALGDEAAVECLKRGMADYVLKENLRRLPLAVRRALDVHQAQLERSRAEEALKALARGTAQVTGEAFFPALVENLARALGVRWALVGRLVGSERGMVETLALWDADHLADNIIHELAGAPCEDVIREGLCIYTDGVRAKFPRDTLLQEMGAECYIGAPLHAADGGVVGLLAVLDDRPYRPPPGVEDVFQVFAARAAAELERLQKVAALEEAAEEWQRTFNMMSDMVTIHDPEFRIVRANRAAARAFGCEPEDMIGKPCYQVFHQLDCPVENCPLQRSLRSGEMEILELFDPTIGKHLLITTNPMRGADGGMIGVVHVARDITARKRTEATLRALNAAAAALQRAGLTETEIYGTATQQLAALGLRGAITLFDEATNTFTFEDFFLPGGLLAGVERLTGITAAGFRFPRARVPAYAQVVESGQALFVADSFDQIVAELLPESVSHLAGRLAQMIGQASAILAPLRVEDRVIGVLHVGSDWLTEADIPAITAFADQLSAALENARLYQAALQAAERRNILHWASQEIVRVAEDPEQVYHAVHQAAAQLMPCEAFVIALADETRQEVTAVYLVDQGGRWPAQRGPSGHGLSGHVLASGEPLLIQDFSPDSSEIETVQFGDPEHVRSILAVPMRLGERIIGVISAQSYQPRAYTTDDQHLLEMLAAHAAVAVENARLFQSERQRAADLARANRLITALGHVAARIETAPDPDRVMETLGAELRQIGLTCLVALLQPDGKSLTIRYISLDSAVLAMAEKLTGLKARGFRMSRERWSHFSEVVERGRPVFVADVEPWAFDLLPPAVQPMVERIVRLTGVTAGTRAVTLPLKGEGQVIGTLTMWGEDLREADLPAATVFANQVAGALERARLFAETRRRAEETAALLATAQAITSLDLDAVLETIAGQARTLFRADGSRIHLIEPDGETLRCVIALHDRAEAVMGLRPKLGEGMTGRVALEGRPELIPNALADPQAIHVPGTPVEPESMIMAPLKVRGQVVGVMTVSRLGKDRPFTESDLTLLTAFANQAAVAIENARLFEQMKRRAQQLTLVSEIASRAVAVLDPDALLWETAEATQTAFGYPDVLIFLVDHQHRQIIRKAWAGCYKRRETTNDVKPIEERGIIDWVAARGETVLANDVRRDPRYVPLFERTAAELCVPLRDGETIIGGINVESDAVHAFDQSDVLAMEALADTLVVALRNARLYAETRRRAEELGVLADVSTALREAGTVAEMVPIFLQRATEVVGGIVGTIFLVEPGTDDLVAQGQYPLERDRLDLRHGRGEGITGYVAATGEIYISEDLVHDPLARILPEEAGRLSAVRTNIALPLRAQEQIVGVMHIGLGEKRAFTDEEVRLLTAIAEMAGNSLHRAALHEQTTRHLQRLTAIRNIDRAISSSLDLKVVLNVLLTQITGQPGVDAADVLLFHPQTRTLEYAAGRGFYTTALQHTRLRLGEGPAGQAALEQRTVSISDLRSQVLRPGSVQVADLESGPRPEMPNLQSQIPGPGQVSNLKSEGFTAYYGVPLISKGQAQGVLEIYQREPKAHDPHWLEFLEAVAAQAAIAIDNATLLDRLQRSNLELALAYDVTLEGWSRALELRDAETEGHTRRVTEMALRLARAMGLNGSTLAHIRRGALLHDIGKLGVPDSVLLKPGELDDEEWDIIRLHPVHAHRLLSPIAYLRPALDIPYCHHERWDGTGYPQGLKGEQIPLPARIFAVVDVYDALRSDRPYRPAWPEEEVRAYIRAQAGKHFDPEVVEVFMRILEI